MKPYAPPVTNLVEEYYNKKWEQEMMCYLGWPIEAADLFTRERIFWLIHNA